VGEQGRGPQGKCPLTPPAAPELVPPGGDP